MARLTIAQRHLAKSWLALEQAYWREDLLGRASCAAYDLYDAFQVACPQIRKWAKTVKHEYQQEEM